MPRKPAPTRLVVDAMLGSLARKLRAFGFDAVYFDEGNDATILALARRRRRILVTADRSLAARSEKIGLPVLMTPGQADRERMSVMVSAARERGITLQRGDSRCSLCNGRLSKIDVANARRWVPAAVAGKHRSFVRCSDCGQTYWRGSHWKKLRSLEKLFESEPRRGVKSRIAPVHRSR